MHAEADRLWMINHQIRPWNVFDDRVLHALQTVRREQFVPEAFRAMAFADTALPLPHGQAMLRPPIEGRLLAGLDAQPDDAALLIGTGSGYVAGVLAQLAGTVTAVDIHADLTSAAEQCLAKAGIHNVSLVTGAYQEFTPAQGFDRILVSGALPCLDERLPDWLNDGGTLLITTGEAPCMHVEKLVRRDGRNEHSVLFETVLPPLDAPRLRAQTSDFRF